MGYSTDYTLTTDCTEPTGQAEIHDALMAIEEAQYALESVDDGVEYETAQGCKWYEHETDLKRLSKKFPTVTFTLSGEGEEQGDVWRTIFRDGKHKTIEPETRWPTAAEVEAMPWK